MTFSLLYWISAPLRFINSILRRLLLSLMPRRFRSRSPLPEKSFNSSLSTIPPEEEDVSEMDSDGPVGSPTMESSMLGLDTSTASANPMEMSLGSPEAVVRCERKSLTLTSQQDRLRVLRLNTPPTVEQKVVNEAMRRSWQGWAKNEEGIDVAHVAERRESTSPREKHSPQESRVRHRVVRRRRRSLDGGDRNQARGRTYHFGEESQRRPFLLTEANRTELMPPWLNSVAQAKDRLEKCRAGDAVAFTELMDEVVEDKHKYKEKLEKRKRAAGEVDVAGQPIITMEEDDEVLLRRQKDIDKGKVTDVYGKYIAAVPIPSRQHFHPRTPNKFRVMSRRAWDGMMRKWRVHLNHWEDPNFLANYNNPDYLPNEIENKENVAAAVA